MLLAPPPPHPAPPAPPAPLRRAGFFFPSGPVEGEVMGLGAVRWRGAGGGVRWGWAVGDGRKGGGEMGVGGWCLRVGMGNLLTMCNN